MAKKFLVNLDLTKNQLLNAAIQNLPSAPSSPVAGQIYYNTSEARIYFWDGNSMTWIDMSGDIRSIVGGAALTSNESNGIVTLDVNVDNQTVEVYSDTLRVKDGGIDIYKIANLSQNISINDSSSAIPTAAAVKNYVSSVTGALGNLEGGWDVSTWASFPQVFAPAVIKAGDYWYATTAGTINTNTSTTVKVNIGDVFIAKVDNAQSITEADWLVLEVNRDQATEDVLGLVRIADQSTVNTGTDDTEAVTPLKLKTYLDNRTGGYSTYIGNGMNTTFNVTHGLGTSDVIVAVYQTPTMEEVMVDVSAGSSNFVTISFATAPSTNEYRVVIKK